ncbi:MAG: hypothetical protein R3B69_02475 [Candidatus Paceibacterota bacterium]
MHVIEVMPLSRSTTLASLTYYSSQPYDIGSIITVPVRSKEVRALVVGTQPVSAAKTAVRAATFSLKKLAVQREVRPLPPLLIETAKQLSKTVPASLGSILYALLPEEVRNGSEALESNFPCIGVYETPAVSILEATEVERMRVYRSRIREAFAHRGSVLFLVPTSVDVARAEEALAQGIENRIITFMPKMATKKRQRTYEAFHDLSHAKLIIATPAHCFLDRHDITHIIIDQSRSQFYQARTRPYLNYREVMKTVAKISGRQVIMGDLLPSSEDEHWRREDIYQTEHEHPKRIAFSNTFSIIKQTDKPKPDIPFELYGQKFLNAIEETLKERKNIFLYSARRGIAPIVACVDCGHIFRCPDSGTPYSLVRTQKDGVEQRWFLASTSGKRVKAADVCPDCGSWRLKERGVGIQHQYDELTKLLPKATVILFDHTTASTKQKAQRLIAEFYDAKGAVLLGTSMTLPYLERPVALCGVPSLDAARSIPTWRAEEEFFALMLRLRELSTERVIVQTRSEPDDVLGYVKAGRVEQFYNDELELRKVLNYPPFCVFIHLTIAGKADSLTELEHTIQTTLAAWKPRFYTSPQSTKDKLMRHALIRVAATDYPDDVLTTALTSLSPAVRIEINPQKIV